MHFFGSAVDGRSGLEMLRKNQIDIAVLDICMPRLTGLEVVESIKREAINTKVLIFTSQDSRTLVRRCAEAGALGYVLKTAKIDELENALTALSRGYSYFPINSDVLSNDVASHDEKNQRLKDSIELLSNRELKVFCFLRDGYSNKEIAKLMSISEKTVSTYKVRIFNKLDVKSVVEIVRYIQ